MKHLLGIVLALLWTGASLEEAHAQLYVCNMHDGSVNEYDAATGTLIKEKLISGLNRPMGIAYSDGALYVVEAGAMRIGKYDAKSGAIINAAFVTGLPAPLGITVSGNVIYATGMDSQTANGRGGLIGKYDAITGAPISPSFIVGLKVPVSVAVTENRLYVVFLFGGHGLGEYDATTGKPIHEVFSDKILRAYGVVQQGDFLWVATPVDRESSVIVKLDAKTGDNVLPSGQPLISGPICPSMIALSGNDLFLASYKDGMVGKYDAASGKIINTSFVTGTPKTLSGIALVPTEGSDSGAAPDLASASGIPWYIWGGGGLLFGCLVALLVFAGFFVLKKKNDSVTAPPTTLENTSDFKLVIFCLIFVGVVAVGGFITCQVVTSYYMDKLGEATRQAREDGKAEAERQKVPPPPPSPIKYVEPAKRTQTAVLVDPDHLSTENNWLAAMIARRMAGLAHLALHKDETSVPDMQVKSQVTVEDCSVHLEITGFASDPIVVDLKPVFAWDPAGYVPLATKLLGSTTAETGDTNETLPDELTVLQELTEPNLAHEDVTLSALLQKHPAWPALHEQAALLLVAMALRDRAGIYSDSRSMLSRATAHLALAQALRGTAPPTVVGEIADAGIRALSGREIDADTRLQAIAARPDCPSSAKPWIDALRLRAKDDWRVVTPNAQSPLLVKIAWFQVLNNNLTALGATKRLENLGDSAQVSDWGHAALSNLVMGSVETGNEFCQQTTKQEIGELAEALKIENAAPDSTASLGAALTDPLSEKLYVGPTPTLKIIGPEMFKNFASRHLLLELDKTFFWLRDSLGVGDDVEKFRAATVDSFAGMRGLENLGFFTPGATGSASIILKEVAKHNTTWFPWELADGQLPGNNNDTNLHPDIDTLNTFYQDGLPFGTVYNIAWRKTPLFIASGFHKMLPKNATHYNLPVYPYPQDLRALAPDYFSIFQLDEDSENVFKNSQPWWDYNLLSIGEAEKKANSLDDDDYVALLKKHAELNPDAWFQLADRLGKEGKDDDAAEAYRKGFDECFDQVLMSNQVGPLVDYYYDHGRKDDAGMVAKRAAEVYSCEGLTIYCKLLEKMGQYADAETNAKAIADRYDDRSVLDALYAAHPGFFQAENKVLLDKIFPQGLQKVEYKSFSGPPVSGVQFTSDSALLQEGSLQSGDIVVAFDGYRVENEDQYDYVRALSTDPKMELIIWRKDRYLIAHTSAPDRRFRVDLQTYKASDK